MIVKDEKRWPCENKRLILFNYIKYSFINRGKKISLLVSFSNVPHHIFCFHVLASVRLSWTPSKPTCPMFSVMGTVAIFTHLPLLTAYWGLLFINFKLFLSCEARFTNKNTQSDRHYTYPTWWALHAGMKSNGFPAISNFSTSNYLTNRKRTKNQKIKHLHLKSQLAAPKGHISHGGLRSEVIGDGHVLGWGTTRKRKWILSLPQDRHTFRLHSRERLSPRPHPPVSFSQFQIRRKAWVCQTPHTGQQFTLNWRCVFLPGFRKSRGALGVGGGREGRTGSINLILNYQKKKKVQKEKNSKPGYHVVKKHSNIQPGTRESFI